MIGDELAIARALIGDPKLLLIDEISMGLMPIAVDKAFELIKKINDDGVTILLVEQNAKNVEFVRISDHAREERLFFG